MTRDDVIRMAQEAGFSTDEGWLHVFIDRKLQPELPNLERFAALVAAAERDECAKEGDRLAEHWWNLRRQMSNENERRHLHSKVHGAEQVATAIRARGEQ